MTTIYKYNLGYDGETVKIKGRIRKILNVAFQPGEGIVCWCEIDDRYNEVEIDVIAIGTGWEDLPKEIDYMDYIGTAQDGLGYVWHYYATPFLNSPAGNELGDVFDAFFGVGVK